MSQQRDYPAGRYPMSVGLFAMEAVLSDGSDMLRPNFRFNPDLVTTDLDDRAVLAITAASHLLGDTVIATFEGGSGFVWSGSLLMVPRAVFSLPTETAARHLISAVTHQKAWRASRDPVRPS